MRIQIHILLQQPSFFFFNWLRPYDPFCTILEQHKLRINTACRITCLKVDSYALYSVIHMVSDLCTLQNTHCTISVHPLLYELGQTKHTYGTNTGLRGYGSASAACAPLRMLLLQISWYRSRYAVSACSSSVKWSELKKKPKNNKPQTTAFSFKALAGETLKVKPRCTTAVGGNSEQKELLQLWEKLLFSYCSELRFPGKPDSLSPGWADGYMQFLVPPWVRGELNSWGWLKCISQVSLGVKSLENNLILLL